MDCNEAYFHLQLKGRGETPASEFAELERHLASCPNCLRVAQSLEAEDAALERAMNAIEVPHGLRFDLHRQFRDSRRAHRRRESYRVLTAAAAILLAVGIGLGLTSASRPQFDLVQHLLDQDERHENRDHATRQWLAAHRLPERLPMAFNMAYLVGQGTDRIQGREVPFLLFQRPGEGRSPRVAKVYYLRDNQFTGLKNLRESPSSHFQTRIIRDERQFPGLTFVILFTGQMDDDLNLFLVTNNQT